MIDKESPMYLNNKGQWQVHDKELESEYLVAQLTKAIPIIQSHYIILMEKEYERGREDRKLEAHKAVVKEIKEGLEECGWFTNPGDGTWGKKKAAWRTFWERF